VTEQDMELNPLAEGEDSLQRQEIRQMTVQNL